MLELLDANLQLSGRGILAPTTLVGNTNICLGERLQHSILSPQTEFNIQSKCLVNSKCRPSPALLPSYPYIWRLASQTTILRLIQKTWWWSPWSWSSRCRILILITSWWTTDNLLQVAITSATWQHTQWANHHLYTAAWTKDSPNHTLKETNLRNLESMDQEHGLGADDAATSVISAKENTRAKG